MARLEDITVGATVSGIAGSASVSIIATKWHGNVLEVTYRTSSAQPGSDLLYRDDEAHMMSITVWGSEARYTKKYNLGIMLASITRHFLLLTATPYNGKEEEF